MNAEFRKGLTKALIYYVIALALTYLTYLASGRAYVHGPGFTHIVAFMFIVTGGIWLISNVVSLLITPHKKAIHGSLIIHIMGIGSFLGYMGWIFYQINNPNHKVQIESEYLRISNNGDTILIAKDKGDTTYLKIRDSVYVNHYTHDSIR